MRAVCIGEVSYREGGCWQLSSAELTELMGECEADGTQRHFP